MTRLLTFLTLLAISTTALADDEKEKKLKQSMARAIQGTPEIDGDIEDAWKHARPFPVKKPVQSVTDIPTDQMATATVRLMWDAEHVYVLWNVTDSKLSATANDPWEQDSVEIFIDERGERTTFYQADDAQYRVNYEGEISGQGAGYNHDHLRAAAKKTEDGYVVEMGLKLGYAKGVGGTKLRMEFQLNDDPGDGHRRAIAKWKHTEDDSWEDTSNFGSVLLQQTPKANQQTKSPK